jgi:urea transport system ATP-binding protein
MLEISRLDAYYGQSRALHGLSLRVPRGSLTCVMGRNGVGKTTLMRALMGHMDRCTGAVRLDDVDLLALPQHARVRAGLGYVPQGRGILPDLTVRENLALGALVGTRTTTVEEAVLDLFPMLRGFLDRRGGDLSGGQQQQLAIARALLTRPKMLLLDEPTEGIQPNVVELIEQVLLRLNRDGLTILLVEQNVAFVRRAAQRFAILERGAVAADGPIEALTDELVHRHIAV